MNAGKYIAPVLVLAMLSGCATYPIAKNLREEAKPLTVRQVKADPAGTQGSVVIWGGRIVDVANDTNGGEIYIMNLPLRGNGKPLIDASTAGRFIAVSGDFLDPEAYPEGRLITVAGEVAGVRREMLQNIRYTYPVLDIKETHVWPVMQQEYYYYGPGWDWGWGPWWGWGPGWWGYGGGFYYPYYDHGGYHAGHGGFEEHPGFEGHGAVGGGRGFGGGGGFGAGAGHAGR